MRSSFMARSLHLAVGNTLGSRAATAGPLRFLRLPTRVSGLGSNFFFLGASLSPGFLPGPPPRPPRSLGAARGGAGGQGAAGGGR